MNRKFFVTAAVLCLASILNAGTYTRVFEKTYPLASGGQFSLRNTNGSIHVESWNKNEVYVKAVITVKSGSRRTAEDLMEQTEIQVNASPEKISVITRQPSSRGWNFLGWIFGGGGQVSVSYTIHVPDELNLSLRNTNGKVTVKDAAGDMEISTTNGVIDGTHLSGNISARTTNGNVRLRLKQAGEKDRIDARTTNGGVNIHIPAKTNADIEARTVNGSISTDIPLKIQGRHSRRQLSGMIGNGGGALIRLRTTNGSIRIREL